MHISKSYDTMKQTDKLEFAELAIEMHDIESHVIASQSSDWRGNPHPHAMSDNNVVKENGLPHQRARWFAMTTLFDKFQFIFLFRHMNFYYTMAHHKKQRFRQFT